MQHINHFKFELNHKHLEEDMKIFQKLFEMYQTNFYM
jgi:hypothetical protein